MYLTKKANPPGRRRFKGSGGVPGECQGAPGELWGSLGGARGVSGEPRGSRGSPSRFKSDSVEQSGALKSDHAVVIGMKTC